MRDKNEIPVSTAFNDLLHWLEEDLKLIRRKDSDSLSCYPHIKQEEIDEFIAKLESIQARAISLRDEWELLIDFEGGGGG